MGARQQSEAIAFLADPESHGSAAGAVRRIDTHAALVFLAGERAYKLKRAVRLPFLDFSTLASREAACRAELRLNRRTAPEIYREVAAITRQADGRLAFGGDGEILDWVVVMRRFDDSQLLDRLAQQDRLGPELALSLAEAIADFHDRAEPAADGADADQMLRIVEGNAASLRQLAGPIFDRGAVEGWIATALARLEANRSTLDERRRTGNVRHCHGDLHLRNIFLENGRPVIFDALEFDDRLARTDVMYDLAFLLMDLWHRGLRLEANQVLNRYLLLSDDIAGLEPMPLYLSTRAAIRAHVSATMATAQQSQAAARSLRREAGDYLDLARHLLLPTTPSLIGIGGYSGTGKSTLARGLAPLFSPPPGAVVLRSDEIRKRLLGVAPEDPLDVAVYAPEVSAEVYEILRRRVGRVLAAGYVAIADAVNDRDDSRAALAEVAREAGTGFTGLWLAAGPEDMAKRIESRGVDASDATVEVMRNQIARGSVPETWPHLDAGKTFELLLAEARRRLAEAGIALESP